MNEPSPTLQPGIFELVRELGDLERAETRSLTAAGLAGIPAWHPRSEGDAGDDTGDDTDDKSKTKTGDDTGAADDKPKGKGKGKGDTDDDSDDASELGRARKAAAAANRELRRIRDESEKAKTDAAKAEGKWKDLYESSQAELDKLKGEVATSAKGRLVEAAAVKYHARNAAQVARLVDMADIEDEADAERAVRKLTKSDEYLFNETKTRQKRGAGGRNDDDEDDADDGRRKPKVPVNRLRRGLEAASKT
jgi:hypothetical protein